MGILLFVLKYMYISLLLKMINWVSWPAKIMASPYTAVYISLGSRREAFLSQNISMHLYV